MRPKILSFPFCAIISAIMMGCAGQVQPTGGPVDTTPPAITESTPLPNALHVQHPTIVLKFSKYVDRASVERSVFLSPPAGSLSFDWGGTEVRIDIPDSLRENTTYILTLGTDVVDRRSPPNRLSSAFALPFSTGDHIDSASISGRVFSDRPEGIMVFAYKLDARRADTLDPAHTKPDYLTQTGKNGTYNITNVAFGTYRIIAVRDEFRNLTYDPQIDEFGVTMGDIRLAHETMKADSVYFRMTKEDTSAPFISSARSLDRSHVLLRFNEPIDTTRFNPDYLSIVDTLNGSAVRLQDVSGVEDSPAEMVVSTSLQESLKTYRVAVSHAWDLHGNSINPVAASAIFTSVGSRDTLRPTIDLAGISDSAKTVLPEDTLRCSFGEPVMRASFEHGFALKDAEGKHIEGLFAWHGSASVSYFPLRPLETGRWYSVQVILDSLKDLAGNGYRDSIWTRRFHLVEEKFLGSIAGIVRGHGGTRVHVTASEITSKTIKPRSVQADSAGSFVIPHLQQGKYLLSGFEDTDSNGVYTFGKPFPFRHSENFFVLNDTLKVRARWPLEGIIVRMK